MSSERREHVRQRVSRVSVKVASQEAFRASYLRDLSMGGLFVRSRAPLPVSAPVVVELSVEGSDPLRLRGEVARHERADDGSHRGFGVRFSTVDAETKTALEALLAAHQQPTHVPSSPSALEAELAEARGTLEAYEEALAQARENEAELTQRVEASAAESAVLAQLNHELQTRVKGLEAERATSRSQLEKLSARLKQGEAEAQALYATTTRLATELKVAREAVSSRKGAHEDTVGQLMVQFERESAQAAERQEQVEAELAALREQLATRDDGPLRAELQDLSAQLDDERLKSMALQRALQRFVEMGGIIPPRKE